MLHMTKKIGRLAWIWLVLPLLLATLPLQLLAQKGKGGSGGGKTTRNYSVAVHNQEGLEFLMPTYLPTCTATVSSNPARDHNIVFPRHDLCATVTTSSGAQITDDIGINVKTTNGLITAVTIYGQDVYGEEGIAHRSETLPINPPVAPSSNGFTLHVHADNVPIWKLSEHLGGERVEIVGYISIGDITYVPQ